MKALLKPYRNAVYDCIVNKAVKILKADMNSVCSYPLDFLFSPENYLFLVQVVGEKRNKTGYSSNLPSSIANESAILLT